MFEGGKWSLIIKSPMGAMPAELDVVSDGATFHGTMSGQGRSNDVSGAIDGNEVTWSVAMTAPMPMNMEFRGAVDGGQIEGQVKAGAFGTFKFAGKRI